MRFVIADDYPSMRARTGAFVKRGGHEIVGEAKDGNEAIALCRTLRPDVILLDINMPGLGGEPAAEVILAEGLAGTVIMCSSASQKAIAARLTSIGAKFLTKPFHREDFLIQLQAALDG